MGLWACQGSDGNNRDSEQASNQEEDGDSANSGESKGKDGGSKPEGKGKGKDKGEDKPGKGKDGEDGEKDPGDDNPDEGPDVKFDLGEIPDAKLPSKACPIDFLFVIDSSGSMKNEQENLAYSVPKFIETITKEVEDLEDYHIGVISTDEYAGHQVPECRKRLGGLVRNVDLRTKIDDTFSTKDCGPYKTGKRFMSVKDDLNKSFNCAAKLGIAGYGLERPMDSMRAALSDPMLEKGACNEGFLRKDALLVVVVITDEEDSIKKHLPGVQSGSRGDPADWHKDLLAVKGNDERMVVVLGLLGTPAPNKCSKLIKPDAVFGDDEGAQISPRLIEFVNLWGKRGVVGDVCAKDYDSFFDKALSVIDVACDELPAG